MENNDNGTVISTLISGLMETEPPTQSSFSTLQMIPGGIPTPQPQAPTPDCAPTPVAQYVTPPSSPSKFLLQSPSAQAASESQTSSNPSNTPSIYQRMMHVQETWTAQDMHQDLAVRYSAYENALYCYLRTIDYNISQLPSFFQFPHLFFFMKKNKLYSLQRFPYGKCEAHSTLISGKTFGGFLSFHLQCKCPPNNERTALLEALLAHVREYSHTHREQLLLKLMEPLKHNPTLAQDLHNFLDRLFLSPEKNFYFSSPNKTSNQPLQSLLVQGDNIPREIPVRPFYRTLSAIIEAPNDLEISFQTPHLHPTALYYGNRSLHDQCHQLTYDRLDHSINSTSQSLPAFEGKLHPYYQPPDAVPLPTAHILHQLTGGNLHLTDQLFKLLARGHFHSPGATVICTSANNSLLIDFLRCGFGSCLGAVPFQSKPKKNGQSSASLPSLNQLTAKGQLKALFFQQSEGKAAVLVRDTLPSHTALPTVFKLLQGKRLPLPTPAWMPKQRFHNRLHLICISDSPSRAEALRKCLKAELIDLSAHEIPRNAPIELGAIDRSWLSTKALPYGLVIHGGGSFRPETQKDSVPSRDGVETFLTKNCFVARGAYCDGFSLYKAYEAFYRSAHHDKAPLLTKVQFVKKARSFIGHKTLKHVGYKRCDPTCKQKPPLWYFTGLDLPLDPPPPPVPLTMENSEFFQYLELIHNKIPEFTIPKSPTVTVSRRTESGEALSQIPLP